MHQRLRHLLRRLDSTRPLWLLALGLMLSGLVLTQSRMGNFAALTALLISTAAYGLFIRRPNRGKLHKFGVGAIGLTAILLLTSQSEMLQQRYQQNHLLEEQRWLLWPALGEMAGQYAVTGAGLGSFATIFPGFRPPELSGFFDHAHNDYAQFLIEAGIPGCLLLLLITGFTITRALARLRGGASRSERAMLLACLTSLLALALHSLVDFNLQIPANALVLVTLMGAVWGVSPRRRT